ncbi:hypothetical protein V7S43_013185 [Phytophthora oleae]|uniref:Restriction endonuclease domain-containing protein n=1 Tax=Phytophthora oleae TaxID=2107226 RepID=A0ABD3F4Z0_9STRA
MDHSGKFAVRWPDVTYTPRKDDRKLARNQVWIYRGEPFVPTFVVEFEKLSGEGSRLSFFDSKMRNEYSQHGVQLSWLIDPRPDCHKMYEYYLDEHGQIQCSDDTAWRNLDGRDVLPGFNLVCVDLDMALSMDPGSVSEEEEDLCVPILGADKFSELVVPLLLMSNGTALNVLDRNIWQSRIIVVGAEPKHPST